MPFQGIPRSPNSAVPTRTRVLPAAMASAGIAGHAHQTPRARRSRRTGRRAGRAVPRRASKVDSGDRRVGGKRGDRHQSVARRDFSSPGPPFKQARARPAGSAPSLLRDPLAALNLEQDGEPVEPAAPRRRDPDGIEQLFAVHALDAVKKCRAASAALFDCRWPINSHATAARWYCARFRRLTARDSPHRTRQAVARSTAIAAGRRAGFGHGEQFDVSPEPTGAGAGYAAMTGADRVGAAPTKS